MKLILNGRVIWENPPELGHFGIKLRKQLLEEQIIERIFERRRAWDIYHFCDLPPPPYLGTTAETPEEIERTFKRLGGQR